MKCILYYKHIQARHLLHDLACATLSFVKPQNKAMIASTLTIEYLSDTSKRNQQLWNYISFAQLQQSRTPPGRCFLCSQRTSFLATLTALTKPLSSFPWLKRKSTRSQIAFSISFLLSSSCISAEWWSKIAYRNKKHANCFRFQRLLQQYYLTGTKRFLSWLMCNIFIRHQHAPPPGARWLPPDRLIPNFDQCIWILMIHVTTRPCATQRFTPTDSTTRVRWLGI